MIRFALRLGRASDVPFVVDSWAKRGHHRGERLRDATARIRAILAAPSTELRVAALSDDEDAILGWAVVDVGAPDVSGVPAPRLHYVYVRKELRGQGIARALLTDIENPEIHGMAQGQAAQAGADRA